MALSFDQAKFVELLKKAIGDRTQKDFASLCGISAIHLSRILNQWYSKPPSVDTLSKIAHKAQNNITYEELLTVCGYVSTASHESSQLTFSEITIDHKFMKATILSALEKMDFSWKLDTRTEDFISISFSSERQKHWYFQFLPQYNEELAKTRFTNNFFNLVFQNIEPNDQISFVTCSESEFNLYAAKKPINLNMNLSIILIDKNNLEIRQECILSKSFTNPPDYPYLTLK